MIQKFKLNTGREVQVDGIHIEETYGGLIEGNPKDPKTNEIVISFHKSRQAFWDKKALFKYDLPLNQLIPSNVFHVYLSSKKIIEGGGSELVVIFYTNLDINLPLSSVIEENLKDLDWENNAEDWEF